MVASGYEDGKAAFAGGAVPSGPEVAQKAREMDALGGDGLISNGVKSLDLPSMAGFAMRSRKTR
jgi:hypothetical protein